MVKFIHLPGIGSSGEKHWQTLWEQRDPTIRRFQPTSWDQPDLDDWIQALERAVCEAKEPPVLVAHSLACLLVAHWQRASSSPVKGALLVAVPDPQSPVFPAQAAAFACVPEERFRFPLLVVASADDPYASLSYAQTRAKQWGGDCINIGEHGHINGQSGLNDWPKGREILEEFYTRL